MDPQANSGSDHSSIYASLHPDHSLRIQTGSLARGIDNCYVDIQVNRRDSTNARKLVPLLMPRLAVFNPENWDNADQSLRVQRSYEDMMTVLMHRVKNLTRRRCSQISALCPSHFQSHDLAH